VWDKVLEEQEELEEAIEGGDKERIVSELGDLLFAMVSYARHLGLVAEEVLRRHGETTQGERHTRGKGIFGGDGASLGRC